MNGLSQGSCWARPSARRWASGADDCHAQRTALSHAFGAFAASLVGVAEYYSHTHGFKLLADLTHLKMGAMGFEIVLGSLTTTGSLIAFGKLQGLVPGRPVIYRGQNIFNMSLLAATIGLFIYLIFVP